MKNKEYQVVLLKVLKHNKSADNKVRAANHKVIHSPTDNENYPDYESYDIRILVESVYGITLMHRFVDKLDQNKPNCLVAKKVRVLGKFKLSDLSADDKKRKPVKYLLKNEWMVFGDNDTLKTFKRDCSDKVRRAFIERFFATFDYSLCRSCDGRHKRDWIIEVRELETND